MAAISPASRAARSSPRRSTTTIRNPLAGCDGTIVSVTRENASALRRRGNCVVPDGRLSTRRDSPDRILEVSWRPCPSTRIGGTRTRWRPADDRFARYEAVERQPKLRHGAHWRGPAPEHEARSPRQVEEEPGRMLKAALRPRVDTDTRRWSWHLKPAAQGTRDRGGLRGMWRHRLARRAGKFCRMRTRLRSRAGRSHNGAGLTRYRGEGLCPSVVAMQGGCDSSPCCRRVALSPAAPA